MKRFMILLLFLVFWCYTECADECGDRCSYGEVCLNNGTCVDSSELVSCGFFSYCMKGQQCCNFGCIPEGAVCCGSIFYCQAGQECCGLFDCCSPGLYCFNKTCIPGERSTTSTTKPVTTRRVQTTYEPFTTKRDSFTTRYVRTTWRPQTVTTERFVTITPRKSSASSSSESSFLWWHGLITAIVVIKIMLIVIICLRRYLASKSNAHGSGGQVLSVSQPKVVYDKYAKASNPVLPQYHPKTGNIDAGTTATSGVTVTPNLQQHLMVTNTGIPPYIIQENKNANVRGNVIAVPVNNMHQTVVHTAARTQTIPHPYANSRNIKAKKEASVKYLPHL